MPAERDAETYNMNHRRRGLALIFNHKNFEPRRGLGTRIGTDVDRDNLKRTLTDLDFDVRVYEDLPFRELVSSEVLKIIRLATPHSLCLSRNRVTL